ncbi:hypothetical protein [Streptococcus sciuri]|uniref:ABC transporter permease n=1 Tax=Streptococcus sciuri TaxID=2973939 RepID=A0ABT2F4X5_9STRE|nr:hypothetical protein [Streptococcus sciuri]MCS4487503.1 hypothetical protein [Streptococcus sciuri]
MKKFIRAEILKIYRQKFFIIALILYFVLSVFLLTHIRENTIVSQYRFFATITILLLTFYQILSIGELQDKKIIRYYLEYIPDRYKFICYEYLKYICLYIFLNFIFCSFQVFRFDRIEQNILIYFIIFCLYIGINMNILFYIEKTSVTIIVSSLLLWVLPNLVNFLLENKSFYSIQLFYYLSPDSFSSVTSTAIFTSSIYFVAMVLFSIIQFVRKEY